MIPAALRTLARAAAMVILVACGAAAQTTPSPAPFAAPSAARPAATPFLPQDHWVHDALRRLAADPPPADVVLRSRRSITRAEAARALRLAADREGDRGARARVLLARFLEEFPRAEGAPGVGVDAAVRVGVEQGAGALRPGTGYGRDAIPSEPPVAEGDFSEPLGGARVSVDGAGRWAAVLEGGYRRGSWRAESFHGVVGLGPVLLWGGRRPVGYGPGQGGGLVFGDLATVDGAGVQLAEPARGPGFLRHLGPVHVETFLARTGQSGTVESPWLWGARGSIRPHPRLTLGVNRGAIFGGANVETTFRDLVYIAIGKHAGKGSAIENQVVAVDVVYRLPVPVGAEAYVEWGFEDSAGAWRNVPAVLWGVSAWELPGLPGARLGVERTTFAGSCCGNPIWYRHIFLLAGWTQDRLPLGHPLGGHGDEWLVYGRGGALDERLQLRASVAFRDRQHENLYAPDRAGRSQAGRLEATWLAPRWEVGLVLVSEAGRDWDETVFRTTARVRF